MGPISFARRAVRAVNRRVRTRSAMLTLRRDARRMERVSRLAIVVAVRGSVHLAEAAMRHLVGHIETVCVLNGLTAAERERLQREFTGVKFLHVSYPLRHHDVIEPLIWAWDDPFWLVDHDCFVLDPGALLQAEAESEGKAGAAFYGYRNPATTFWKPHTFILLLRPRIIRALAEKYGVPLAQTIEWGELTPRVQGVLRSLGLDGDHMPEDSKNYFDTLCLVMCLAEADGVGFHAHRRYDADPDVHPEVVHIGHTSHLEFNPPQSMYGSRGAYFWRLAVDRWTAVELRSSYMADKSALPSTERMRGELVACGVPESVLVGLESLV